MGQQVADQAKTLLKHYLDFRIFVTNIPMHRVDPQHLNNTSFIHLLTSLHDIIVRQESLEIYKKAKMRPAPPAGYSLIASLLEPESRSSTNDDNLKTPPSTESFQRPLNLNPATGYQWPQ